MADFAQFVPQYDGSSRGQFVGQYLSDALTLVTAFDSGNVDQSATVITNPTSLTPTFDIVVRDATIQAPSSTGWRHVLFAVENAAGKTPLFRLDRSDMQDSANTPGAAWLPMYTTDFITWTQASSRSLVGGSTGTIEWSFDAPFPAGRVYISTHPIGRYQESVDFAAELLANYSSVASVGASANASGVYHVSPAENDENGRAVGAKNMHSINLVFPGPTTDGHPKRVMVLGAGIHAAGENASWRSFEAFVRWVLDDVSTEAANIRSNWDIHLYFMHMPNGAFDGQKRRNPRSITDGNRAFNFGGTSTVDEIQALSTALLFDLSSVDCFLDFHTTMGNTTQDLILGLVVSADSTAFVAYAESVFGGTASTLVPAPDAGTDIQFMIEAFDPKVSVAPELSMLKNSSLAHYQDLGQKWAKSIEVADADGFFAPPVPPVTVTLSTAAELGTAQPITPGTGALRVSINLVDDAGAPSANLTGLKVAFFDEPTPNALTTPVFVSSSETTDAAGLLVFEVPVTSLPLGGIGYCIVSNTDGSTTQSPPQEAFAGPVELI